MLFSRMLLFSLVAPAMKDVRTSEGRWSPGGINCKSSDCDTQLSKEGLDEDTQNQTIATMPVPVRNSISAMHCESQPLRNHDVSSSLIDGFHLASQLGKMAWQFLNQNIPKCLNVFITTNSNHPLVHQIIRESYMSSKAMVVVDLKLIEGREVERLMKSLWGLSALSCRGLLIDFVSSVSNDVFRLLEASRLWTLSEIRVVIVGSRKKARSILLHEAFRNAPRPLYIGLQDQTFHRLTTEIIPDLNSKDPEEKVQVFGRCLYCNNGRPDVRSLFVWSLGSEVPQDFNPFVDQEDNLQGHLLRYTSMQRYPYVQYTRNSEEKASIVTFKDCVDRRVINTLSRKLNFSYVVRIPPDEQWGVPLPGGNWSGMVGAIHRGEADSTSFLTNNIRRNFIVDHARFYSGEELAIVSLKPQVLPRYLVLLRPFSDDVWLYLGLSTMVWGITLWLFQKTSSRLSETKYMSLSTCLFYAWAVILEDPPEKPPRNITGQMLVGWWLAACLVISASFKSGLIANLAVEDMAPAINTYKDVVEQESWRWAMVKKYFTAHAMTYMRGSSDPVMIKLRESIEPVANIQEGLQKVKKGHFSFLHIQSEVTSAVISQHTDSKGQTPFYISSNGPKVFSPCGYGLRRGAPFGNRFKVLLLRLVEAGLVDHWIQTLMDLKGAEARKKAREKHIEEIERGESQNNQEDEATTSVRLTLAHVMGIFLLLIIGYGISFFVLLGEHFVQGKCGFKEDFH